jgi:hypothetical protein
MMGSILRQPHRPPLIQIKHKNFKYINVKHVYPIVIRDKHFNTYSRINFFSAPYYNDTDVFNVYISYHTFDAASITAANIASYYDINCEPIKQLRDDMEFYAASMKTPLVIISNYDNKNYIYDLSYFCGENKEGNLWFNTNDYADD